MSQIALGESSNIRTNSLLLKTLGVIAKKTTDHSYDLSQAMPLGSLYLAGVDPGEHCFPGL